MSGSGRCGRIFQSGAEATGALGALLLSCLLTELVGLLKNCSYFLHMNSRVYHPGCTSLVAFNFIKAFTCGASGQQLGQH